MAHKSNEVYIDIWIVSKREYRSIQNPDGSKRIFANVNAAYQYLVDNELDTGTWRMLHVDNGHHGD